MNHRHARVLSIVLLLTGCQEPVDPLAGVGTVKVEVDASKANDGPEVLETLTVEILGVDVEPERQGNVFRFDEVPRGRRHVVATSSMGASAVGIVGVLDEPALVTLELEPAACIVGAIENSNGRETVAVPGRKGQVRTGEGGAFHIFVHDDETAWPAKVEARRDGAPETIDVDPACTPSTTRAPYAKLCQSECCGEKGQPCCAFESPCKDAYRCYLGTCGCGDLCYVGQVECCGFGAQGCEAGQRRVCERRDGCTYWTLWHEAPSDEEHADYEDDDCDGDVDEDWRVTIYRRHAANPISWNEPGADSDHCFSLSPDVEGHCLIAPETGAEVGLREYLRDPIIYRIYTLDAVPGRPDTAQIGRTHVAVLVECFRPEDTIHLYVYRSTEQHARALAEGYACGPVGYVKTEGWQSFASDEVLIRSHVHENSTDRMYDCFENSARKVGFVDHGPAFYAWESPYFSCLCGNEVCDDSETPVSCPNDCGARRGETVWLRSTTSAMCATNMAGWHQLDDAGTNKWTYGTCCPLSAAFPETYPYEVAYTDFEVREAGTYRVTTRLPAVAPCDWGSCVTTGAVYSISGPSFVRTATVDQRENVGTEVVLAERLELEPGPLRVALFDRALDVDAAACEQCTSCDACGASDFCDTNRRFRRVVSGEVTVQGVE